MRAGELDRKVVIESLTDGRDDYAGKTESWSTFATVWAKKIPVRGNESHDADRVVGEAQAVYRIRWLSGVTRKMRIKDGNDYWDILDIQELGRREGLELPVKIHQAV